MRFLRMLWFNIKQFVAVTYFVQSIIITTIASCIIQWLAVRAWGADAQQACMRGALIGMWTSTLFSAGSIGFERFKGTLVYLISMSRTPLITLAILVSSAACFGLIAFPIAQLCWFIMSGSLFISNPMMLLLVWIACSSIALVVASLFVLTPNAIAYEGLLFVPALFFSGIVISISAFPVGMSKALLLLNPLALPATSLLGGRLYGINPLMSLLVSMLWMIVAYALGKYAIKRATVHGTLELI